MHVYASSRCESPDEDLIDPEPHCTMFYRKRHNIPYSEKRSQERVNLPDAECLVIQIQLPEGEVIHGELIDLTIGGAGIRVPIEFGTMRAEDLAQLLIAHPLDGWEVNTPVRLSRTTPDGPDHILFGLQFINEGNLFAQLENAMARYFNRRQNSRVTPELDEQVPISLKWGPHRIHARATDISRDGVGLSVDLVSAMNFEVDIAVQAKIEFPGERNPIEIEATIRRIQRMEDRVFLGLQFEMDPETNSYQGAEVVTAYVKQRKEEQQEWEEGFAA
jgi:c-di-GMP-binding flagellar brake protein YcgR